jgi:hypothetical protein
MMLKINKVNYQINEEYTSLTNLNKNNYNDDKIKDSMLQFF